MLPSSISNGSLPLLRFLSRRKRGIFIARLLKGILGDLVTLPKRLVACIMCSAHMNVGPLW